MDDLVSRQRAIDLVRDVCDAIMSCCDTCYNPETGDEIYKDVLEVDAILKCNKEIQIALRNMPSAEPNIIRCKDCKHAHLTYGGECKHCNKWTDEFGIPEELYLDGDFYCGFAKRRKDE